MKIGMTTFGGDGGKSGISQYILNLLGAWAVEDPPCPIEVLVYRDEETLFLRKGGRCLLPLCFEGRLRPPVLNIAWHQTHLPGLCGKRAYDVLFLPAGNRRLPLHLPCPSVGTVHDFSSVHVEGKYDPLRMFYIRKVLPFLIRRLTLVLTVSESSRRDILAYAGVPSDKVRVTPLGVDHDVYFPRDPEAALPVLSARYGVRPPYLLYISRIEHPGKNHIRLIEAFSRMKARERLPHQLVLAGSDWTRAEEVHRAAKEAPARENILFTGFVRSEDLPLFYAGADLFVFPSLYEGFGMPILEAMASGVPVLCSNLSSLPEVAGDAALLFDPYNEEDMAGAMTRVLGDPGMRARLRAAGLSRSRRYTWSSTAAGTLEALFEAAHRGKT